MTLEDTIADGKCQGTVYCFARGTHEYSGNCWWLRSLGNSSSKTADARFCGSVYDDDNYVSYMIYVVRPALWVNLES